jgi:hypothetical protein
MWDQTPVSQFPSWDLSGDDLVLTPAANAHGHGHGPALYVQGTRTLKGPCFCEPLMREFGQDFIQPPSPPCSTPTGAAPPAPSHSAAGTPIHPSKLRWEAGNNPPAAAAAAKPAGPASQPAARAESVGQSVPTFVRPLPVPVGDKYVYWWSAHQHRLFTSHPPALQGACLVLLAVTP